MRLYLVIERYSLPTVRTVWPISTSQQSILGLLADIDARIPLQHQQHGIDDYVVTLAGFECLPWHDVAKVCKDGDELVIRPLQADEMAARLVMAREFPGSMRRPTPDGRPLLIEPAPARIAATPSHRPSVQWRAHKRRKINLESDKQESSMHDMIKSTDDVAEDMGDIEDGSVSSSLSDVTSEAGETSTSEDESVDESDSGSQESSDASTDSSGQRDSASSSDDSSSSDDDDLLDDSVVEELYPGITNGDTVRNGSSSDVSRNQTDEASTPVWNGFTEHGAGEEVHGLPHQGSGTTHRRNVRRKAVKRLKYLQSQGKLAENAGLQELREYDERNNSIYHSDGNGVTDGEATNPRIAKASENRASVNGTEQPEIEQPEPPAAKTPAKIETSPARPRLDLGNARNFILRPLGVRVPKTEADRIRAQAKLAAPTKPKLAPVVQQKKLPSDDPIQDWWTKINLRAVECRDADIALSTPPFPFKNNWDSQYPARKSKGKRKRVAPEGGEEDYVETYDKYGITEYGDYLDYDDDDGEAEYWEEGALLDEVDDDVIQGDSDQQPSIEYSFPPLPESLESLPVIDIHDACDNDFVVVSALDVSAATNWQPALVHRTLNLLSKHDDGWDVRIADRDLPSRQIDEHGQRIYTKFEMAADQEYDTAEKLLTWDEFSGSTVRLLLRSE